MENRIRDYIESVFRDVPKSERAENIKTRYYRTFSINIMTLKTAERPMKRRMPWRYRAAATSPA